MSDTMTEKMKITALVPYFGSKRNLAAAIVGELGPHRTYWEPFAGSMSVLLAKPACTMESVNDLNGDLINLARVVVDEALGAKLYRRLRRTLMHETIFREAVDRWRTAGHSADRQAPDLESAYDYFICSWLGRNGVVGTESYNQGYCVRYTSNGGHAATRWSSVVESIPAWRRRLRNVTILCRDAFALLDKIDDRDNTAIFVDPPYVRKGAKYIHDFAAADHQRLADCLNRFKRARVVITYYDEPELSKWYAGWTFRPIEVVKAMANQMHRDRKDVQRTATEMLIINGPSFAAPIQQLF